MKRTLEILALSGTLLFSIFGKGIKAEEVKEKPKIEINLGFNFEKQEEDIDYSKGITCFWRNFEVLYRDGNTPEFNEEERLEIENIMKDVKHNKIQSYQEFINISNKNLSENQKIALLNAIGSGLGTWNYDLNLADSKLLSQDKFFNIFQYSLETGEEIGVGVCKQIHAHVEKLANDIGIRASAVSGINKGVGHVFSVLKRNKGSAVIDYGTTIMSDTKNIEKIIGAYQKDIGITSLEHAFFEDGKFKYRLITQDGKNFLDFVGYDITSESLKNELIQDYKKDPLLQINANHRNSSTSVETNFGGLFTKIGQIRGNTSSPLEEMSLSQIGFKREFLTPENIFNLDNKFLNFLIGNKKIKINENIIYGGMEQDNEFFSDMKINGINGDFIFSTNNEKFNFNLGMSHLFLLPSKIPFFMFWDVSGGTGASYKFKIKDITLKPYLVSQYTSVIRDLNAHNYGLNTELRTGAFVDIPISDNINLSIEPHYVWKTWEDEFGGELKFSGENFELIARGHFTNSKYDFCPKKSGLNLNSKIELGNLGLNIGYQVESENYDGEKENSSALGISGNIKY